MDKIISELNKWLEELKSAKLPVFDDLPDVNLYMDQVVSYVDGILDPYSRDEQKLITSFMVNNYVKAKIIEPPKSKRYDKNQLSYLIAICLLKQITEMANMAVLLRKETFIGETNEFYDLFVSTHNSLKNSIYEKTTNSLSRIEKGEKYNARPRKKKGDEEPVENTVVRKNLIDLALRLMIESELNKMVSERILYELGKETYKNSAIFTQRPVEEKFEKKKARNESIRVKKVNTQIEKATTDEAAS